jgi:hypothetical protein
VCTTSGSTATFTSTGDRIIDANQARHAACVAAPQVQQAISVDNGEPEY